MSLLHALVDGDVAVVERRRSSGSASTGSRTEAASTMATTSAMTHDQPVSLRRRARRSILFDQLVEVVLGLRLEVGRLVRGLAHRMQAQGGHPVRARRLRSP